MGVLPQGCQGQQGEKQSQACKWCGHQDGGVGGALPEGPALRDVMKNKQGLTGQGGGDVAQAARREVTRQECPQAPLVSHIRVAWRGIEKTKGDSHSNSSGSRAWEGAIAHLPPATRLGSTDPRKGPHTGAGGGVWAGPALELTHVKACKGPNNKGEGTQETVGRRTRRSDDGMR